MALKRKIELCYQFICEQVRYADVKIQLRQDIFSLHDDQTISACTTDRDKMAKCLDLLKYKENRCFEQFLECLRADYGHVVLRITDTVIPESDNTDNHIALTGELDSQTMMRLSGQGALITDDKWKMLARVLGVKDADLLCIESMYGSKPCEAIYQMLLQWTEQTSRAVATRETVYQALIAVGLKGSAEEIFGS